jgi:alpha-beta hydrolase superfamily lysophospholipase
VHGLTLHSGTFDTIARRLAEEGVAVYAQDLRGHGRWMDGASGNSVTVDYESSYCDLVSLIKSVKAKYPNLPFFCIGESLGADLAMRAAGDMPGTFDGLILSSPAVKIQSFTKEKLEMGGRLLSTPKRQVDIVPFMREFASDDPQIVAGVLNDPLVRKHLSGIELYRTAAMCKPVLSYAKKVPDVPILVMQGSRDRMVRAQAVIKLLQQLKSSDQTVRWFPDRGHLLIETVYVHADTLAVVDNWLLARLKRADVAQAEPSQPVVLLDTATIAGRQ